MSRGVLVLLFHSDLAASRVNGTMIERIRRTEGISVHDVYAKYPDFDVDVTAEQRLCRQHDVLVFQHPIQWYGAPALMKEWIDRVLTYGWAHGPEGTQLKGKAWLSAVSAGWADTDYGPGGRNRRALHDYLTPFEQTAAHCGMQWLEPVVLYASRHADEARIHAHAAAYRARLRALQGHTDPERRDE